MQLQCLLLWLIGSTLPVHADLVDLDEDKLAPSASRRILNTATRRPADNSVSNDGKSWDQLSTSAENHPHLNTAKFDTKMKDYLYIPASGKLGHEETVLMWTTIGDLFVTYDQGTLWRKLDDIPNVIDVQMSTTDDHQIFVYSSSTDDSRLTWISWDRAHTFQRVTLPSKPQMSLGAAPEFLSFHPKNPKWILYSGTLESECRGVFCKSATFISKDSGKKWDQIFSGDCQWITGLAEQDPNDELMYCTTNLDIPTDDFDGNFSVHAYWSRDYFKGEKNELNIENVFGIIPLGKFLCAIGIVDNKEAEIDRWISTDGVNFSRVKFPSNFKPSKMGDAAFTFDESSLWLFEPFNKDYQELFGTVLKSDRTGSELIKVLDNVNCASGLFSGFVDFDRLESVEGVAIANVVTNPDAVLRGEAKKIQTFITHSDGARWEPLVGPGGEKLNLHGFTERLDMRNKPSSPTAVGVLMGRGNLGDSLKDLRMAHTYMSRDAGITWQEVSKLPTFWEFGDSGSVIVLVNAMEPTNIVTYSEDDGQTWHEFTFSNDMMKINNLATIPSDTSRKFIIFAIPPLGDDSWATVNIQLDFGHSIPMCKDEDFEWWSPEHPQLKTKCLLGHEIEYRRKIPGRMCSPAKYIEDPSKSPGVEKRTKNCKCTELDFECDINYEQDASGKCVLVPGANPPTKESQCANGATSWREITGYRKIAASTCVGGVNLGNDKIQACPGKEDDFKNGNGNNGDRNGGNNDDKKDDKKNNGDSGKDSKDSKESTGFFHTFFILVVLVSVFAGVYLTRDTLFRYFPKFDSVQLPESEYSDYPSQSLDLARRGFSHLAGLWHLLQSNIPLFGKRVPQDHLGFYSRMNDDERYAGMEDDDVFEDDESDEGDAHLFSNDELDPQPGGEESLVDPPEDHA